MPPGLRGKCRRTVADVGAVSDGIRDPDVVGITDEVVAVAKGKAEAAVIVSSHAAFTNPP